MTDGDFTVGGFQAALRAGRATATELVEACLARIEAVDTDVAAWTFLDPAYAREQAARADRAVELGEALGPLHGVPVGVKDVIDTADMPTEDGTVLHAGRRPHRDATVVARLRQAGAIVLGKTVTAELALYHPGKTRNPHDPARTPGGSSQGSAAAVAAGMVPLAIGTQTNGSVIRPASFCGVVGFKPSHGLISRAGILPLSAALDHVGVFATNVDDAARLAECLIAYDPRDPDTRPQAPPPLARVAAEEPPLPPRLAFVKPPTWDDADPETREAFGELVGFLGERAAEVPLPSVFDDALAQHASIMEPDVAVAFVPEAERGRNKLSAGLRALIARGSKVAATDYIRAKARVPLLERSLGDFWNSFDAILTPAAAGEAPVGLETTGNPAFCTAWTLIGVPTVSLPLLTGPNGLPVGVQLVGRKGDDARLLRTAQWLSDLVLKPARRRRK